MRAVVVEKIFMGDSDDPYLMAAFPLADWEKSDKGQWVMAHALEKPVFHCDIDMIRMGYQIRISAVLTEEAETEMYLRWDVK